MIRHIVTCDGEMCDNSFDFYPMQRPTERVIPDGWLLVFSGDNLPIQAQEPRHFCSALCCHRWTGKSLSGKNEQPEEVK